MAGETIKGITIQIGAETTGLSKALSDVNKHSRDIQKELKEVEKLLKLDPSNTELLAQKQKLLGEAVDNSREKLNRLKTAQEQVNEQFARGEINEGQYRAFQREVVKTEQELQKLEKQLKDMQPVVESFGEKMQRAGEKMKAAGKKMADVGKDLSLKVTAPIVGIGTAATMAAVEFESAFAGVRKTVDATEEEFAQLEQGIREMSQRMPAAATDIAAVAEAAGQLGIETPNILKFTETMIGLGEATNLTAEEGATQFARFANIVGMSQQDFDRLGSAVVALGNNFATTEAEIVAMGMRLAGQGAQIGMTEAQIMALAAAMSSVGIEAEAGGTAMSTTLKKMQTAVSLAGEDLNNFAAVARMSAEEFAAAFQADPATALQAFIDGLAASSAAGENLTLILNDLGITGIRESDTLLRLAGANDTLRGAISTATEAWEENSALQNEVQQRYATTESQLAMAKNSLVDLGITIGEIIIPALMSIVESVRPVVEWFANLDDGTKRTIVIIGGLVAAIGPLLVILGMVVSSIGALMPVLAALTGPVGLVVAAIAGLVAGLIYLYNTNEDIRNGLQVAWKAIQQFATEIFGALQAFWERWGNTITSLFQGIWKQIEIVVEMAIGIIENYIKLFLAVLQGDWEGAWNAIRGIVESIWNGIVKTFGNVRDTMATVGRNIVQGLIDGVKNMAASAVQAAKDVANSVAGAVKGFFGISSPSKLMMSYGEDLGEGLAIGIHDSINAVRREAAALAEAANISASGGAGGRGGVGSIVVNVTGNTITSPADEDRLAEKISRKIATSYGLSTGGAW